MKITPQVGAAVIVLKNGRVLLGKRRNTEGHGKWCFPGGGVEAGEAVEKAAARELLEEAGIKARKLEFAGYSDALVKKNNWVTLFFKCTSFSGKPRVKKNEKISEWKWFSKKRLPKPLFKHTEDAFKKKLV